MVELDPVGAYVAGRRFGDTTRRRLVRFFRAVGKTPEELLEMQRIARTETDEDKQFVVLDIVERFVSSMKGTKSTKETMYYTVRGFFKFHRRRLPDDDRDFARKLASDRPRVVGRINFEVFQNVVNLLRNDPRRLSMILTQYSTFSGAKELCLINENYGYEIGQRIQAGESPIELAMVWQRKENDDPWFTCIADFGCVALKQYFESVRGYPGKGEPIWLSERPQDRGKNVPINETSYAQMFTRVVAKLGYRPQVVDRRTLKHRNAPKNPSHLRFGLGVHELRDLAISQSQRAISEGFNPESAEYYAGHSIDPFHYRKLHNLDPQYRKEQYVIVQKFLNPNFDEQQRKLRDQTQEIAEMRERLATLEAVFSEKIKIK